MSKLAEGINERLINEYISKVKCCDECFASVYCTVNGLRESRVPQDYCVKNIKSYFGDNANQNIDLAAGDLISRAALKRAIEPYRYAICGFEGILTLIDNAPTVEAYTLDQVKELVDLNKKLSEERSQWCRDAERRRRMISDELTASEAECRLVQNLYGKVKGTKQMNDNKSLCDTCLYKYCCVDSDAGIRGANHSVCHGYAPIKNEEGGEEE